MRIPALQVLAASQGVSLAPGIDASLPGHHHKLKGNSASSAVAQVCNKTVMNNSSSSGNNNPTIPNNDNTALDNSKTHAPFTFKTGFATDGAIAHDSGKIVKRYDVAALDLITEFMENAGRTQDWVAAQATEEGALVGDGAMFAGGGEGALPGLALKGGKAALGGGKGVLKSALKNGVKTALEEGEAALGEGEAALVGGETALAAGGEILPIDVALGMWVEWGFAAVGGGSGLFMGAAPLTIPALAVAGYYTYQRIKSEQAKKDHKGRCLYDKEAAHCPWGYWGKKCRHFMPECPEYRRVVTASEICKHNVIRNKTLCTGDIVHPDSEVCRTWAGACHGRFVAEGANIYHRRDDQYAHGHEGRKKAGAVAAASEQHRGIVISKAKHIKLTSTFRIISSGSPSDTHATFLYSKDGKPNIAFGHIDWFALKGHSGHMAGNFSVPIGKELVTGAWLAAHPDAKRETHEQFNRLYSPLPKNAHGTHPGGIAMWEVAN